MPPILRPATAGTDSREANARAAPGLSGAAAEARALDFLRRQGLVLVERNFRIARGPRARAGEVDLVMREGDGTLVFVEVRVRRDVRHGGAAASIDARKRARIAFAAEAYLRRLPALPPCRFDVVAIDGDRVEWLRAAFDASPR